MMEDTMFGSLLLSQNPLATQEPLACGQAGQLAVLGLDTPLMSPVGPLTHAQEASPLMEWERLLNSTGPLIPRSVTGPSVKLPGKITFPPDSSAPSPKYVLGDDPLSRLMRERDDARALALRAVENGEAALAERERMFALLQATQKERDAALAKIDELEPDPRTDVDRVIDQLDKRIVPETDRFRLRRHLDKADAPDRSRIGQDKALGGAIGRKPTAYGLRMP